MISGLGEWGDFSNIKQGGMGAEKVQFETYWVWDFCGIFKWQYPMSFCIYKLHFSGENMRLKRDFMVITVMMRGSWKYLWKGSSVIIIDLCNDIGMLISNSTLNQKRVLGKKKKRKRV